MKIHTKIIIGMVFFINTVFANESLSSIYENIILKNSQQSIVDIKTIKKNIQNNQIEKAKKDFKDLVISWKSVDAVYILGDLDDNYLDTPRYIDIFHQGNEDMTKQLDLIISKKDDLTISLYKNSQKTINAMEYILFTKKFDNMRVKNIALIIVDELQENLQEIYDGYIAVKDKFIKDELASNAMMLNSLIENSYKLKEWRVGNPAGLSRKFEGKVSNDKAEYYISKNSIVAIQAILETHLMILEDKPFNNFGTIIKSYKVNEELNDAIKYLKEALIHTEDIQDDDFGNAKFLYADLKKESVKVTV